MIERLFLLMIATGAITACSTFGQPPKINRIDKPDYAIIHLSEDANNSEIAKAVVISWKQCTTYVTKLSNLIDASQES